MTKAADILNKWRHYIQPEEELSDVIKVLESFGFDVRHAKGSHWAVSHSEITKEKCDELGLRNEFTIPTIKGKKVAKVYVKRLIKYIDILED